jgi:uncharacterized membrane protein
MLDWEILMLLEEREDEDEATRNERRAFRQELQWNISPLVVAAMLLAHASAGLGRFLISRVMRAWCAVRMRRVAVNGHAVPMTDPVAQVHAVADVPPSLR